MFSKKVLSGLRFVVSLLMLSSGLLPNFIEGVAKKISKAEETEDSIGLLLTSSYMLLVL